MTDDIQAEIDKMLKAKQEDRRAAVRLPISNAKLTLAWIDRDTGRVELGQFELHDLSRTGFSFQGEVTISHHQAISFILHFPNSKDLKGYGNVAQHRVVKNKTFIGIKFAGLNRTGETL
jgi:hypothetical protein